MAEARLTGTYLGIAIRLYALFAHMHTTTFTYGYKSFHPSPCLIHVPDPRVQSPLHA